MIVWLLDIQPLSAYLHVLFVELYELILNNLKHDIAQMAVLTLAAVSCNIFLNDPYITCHLF